MQIEPDETPLADDEIPDWHKKIIDEHLAEIKKDGFKGKDARIVLREIREEFVKKNTPISNRPYRIGALPDIKIPDNFDKIEVMDFDV